MNKNLEAERYNSFSQKKLDSINLSSIKEMPIGSTAYPLYLNSPYIFYEKQLKTKVNKTDKVLDLCCGDGIHTIFLGHIAGEVVAVDLAQSSIEFAKMRTMQHHIHNITYLNADVENLNLNNQKFDFITCVGSISYIDINILFKVLKKYLKNNGHFVFVDSFNYNPIYRINRFIHYLKNKRSYSTLKRMPNLSTIEKFKLNFSNVEVSYFGIFSFAGSFLSFLFNEKVSKKIIDLLDKKLTFLKIFSFKIVIQGQNIY